MTAATPEIYNPSLEKGRLLQFDRQKPRAEYPGITLEFAGIEIPWERGKWIFPNPKGSSHEPITKDAYTIWNQQYWREIAERLAQGEVCAVMVAGSWGACMLFEDAEWQKKKDEKAQHQKLAEIKVGRAWENKFVAWVHPEDQTDLIDPSLLHPNFRHLNLPEHRMEAYAWAQHVILPANTHRGTDKGLIKDDGSISCFWIPDHWGFEGLGNELRRVAKHGIFGGGSLNYHGEQPSFTSEGLMKTMTEKPTWLRDIDFIIRDPFPEASGIRIARSQPMVSFMSHALHEDKRPVLTRHGSLSLEKIREMTGYDIVEAENVRYASSETEYNPENNAEIDARVLKVRALTTQFKDRVDTLTSRKKIHHLKRYVSPLPQAA